jgi:hypothetical protein
MAGTFLSYRRDDAAGWAGRLYEYLVREWGPDEVFMDIDAIAPGEDFRKAIASTMDVSDTVLVVIGPTWVNATDHAGRRRLEDERDTHRAEVVAALQAPDVRVIPVLVGGASMPVAPQLPDALQELAYRNAAVIDDRRFPADVRGLIDAVAQARNASTRWAAPDAVDASGSAKPRRLLARSHSDSSNGSSRQTRTGPPRGGRPTPSAGGFLTGSASLMAVAGIVVVLVWGALVPRAWHDELWGLRGGAAFLLVAIATWGLWSRSWKLVLAGAAGGLAGMLLWMWQLLGTDHTMADLFSLGTDGVPNLIMLAGAVVVVVAGFVGGRASERAT